MNWVRVAAVVRLELRVQRREPLTVLYMLVFALLATAFAAAGPVELVGDRGPVPRDAPWSLMLASTAITAFGQVITTMVAATVVLRDRADRVADLLVATPLTRREYLLAKLLASLLMLALIYAAVPVGLIAGSLLGGGSLLRAMVGTLPPFVAVVLPTMLAVGALQFSVGVLSGRLWVIVGQGLLLIWLWTATIGWVSGSDGATWQQSVESQLQLLCEQTLHRYLVPVFVTAVAAIPQIATLADPKGDRPSMAVLITFIIKLLKLLHKFLSLRSIV